MVSHPILEERKVIIEENFKDQNDDLNLSESLIFNESVYIDEQPRFEIA